MKLFGTDGIRSEYNNFPMIDKDLIKIGYCFAKSMFGNNHGRIFIGNDGRESSTDILNSLNIGISQQGSDVISVGLLPTPALSSCIYLNNNSKTAGIQITASHNPYFHNGLKFFDNKGQKIDHDMEQLIERYFDDHKTILNTNLNGKKIEHNLTDFQNIYISYIDKYLLSKALNKNTRKLNILVDCANGAASHLVDKIFKNSQINLIPIFNEPNGSNINLNCGATDLTALKDFISSFNSIQAKSTKKEKESILKIDLGVALDGDADRVIFVDEKGNVIDGDKVLFLLSQYYRDKYDYNGPIVGTVMTNYGIQKLYKDKDIRFIETDVGDKNVLDEMKKSNSLLGGESSGHIIIKDNINRYVGDGLITMINFIEIMLENVDTFLKYEREITLIPATLTNISVPDKQKFMSDSKNILAIQKIKEKIDVHGRILIRPSGTENIIRLLVEHEDINEIKNLINYFYDNINKDTIHDK